MKILVLGLGNDLYGDDGVGLRVVRSLRETAAEGDDIAFEECCLTGLALLDVIVGCDALVIVDTIKRPEPRTGRIQVLDAQDLRVIPGPSPHYVSIPQMIVIGRASGLHMPEKVRVVAVEAKNMSRLGEGLSAEMTRSLPAVIEKVREVLIDLRREE